MSKLTTLRAQENLAAGTKGGIIGLGYFLYFYLKNVIGWDLENFVTLVDWEYFIEGSVMAYFGTGAVAGWYRDQQAPWKTVEEGPFKAPEKPVERITHRIEPELDVEFEGLESPARLTAYDPQLRREIEVEEDRLLRVYLCPEGFKTAGVGHLLTEADEPYFSAEIDTPVPAELVNKWYNEDIKEAIAACRKRLPRFNSLPRDLQLVLVNMCFQLGETRLFGSLTDPAKKGFVKTLAYLKAENYGSMADEMLDSKWATQTPARAKRLAARVKALASSIA